VTYLWIERHLNKRIILDAVDDCQHVIGNILNTCRECPCAAFTSSAVPMYSISVTSDLPLSHVARLRNEIDDFNVDTSTYSNYGPLLTCAGCGLSGSHATFLFNRRLTQYLPSRSSADTPLGWNQSDLARCYTAALLTSSTEETLLPLPSGSKSDLFTAGSSSSSASSAA